MAGKLRQLVLRATMDELYASGGNRTRAAKELGISARTLRNYINVMKHGGYGPVPPPPLPHNAGVSKYTHDIPCLCSLSSCRRSLKIYRRESETPGMRDIQQGYCAKCGRVRPDNGKCPRCLGDTTA